jgi:hypothetical protein
LFLVPSAYAIVEDLLGLRLFGRRSPGVVLDDDAFERPPAEPPATSERDAARPGGGAVVGLPSLHDAQGLD